VLTCVVWCADVKSQASDYPYFIQVRLLLGCTCSLTVLLFSTVQHMNLLTALAALPPATAAASDPALQ
jgi:hypothetical protein